MGRNRVSDPTISVNISIRLSQLDYIDEIGVSRSAYIRELINQDKERRKYIGTHQNQRPQGSDQTH